MDELMGSPSPNLVAPPTEDARQSFTDIRAIFGVVLRHWKMVVAVPLIAIAITHGVLRFISPVYSSTAGILVVDPRRPTNAVGDKPPSPMDVNEAAMASEIAVIKSQGVALRLVRELGLTKDPEFMRSPFQSFLEKVGLSGSNSVEVQAGTVGNTDNFSPDVDRAAGQLLQHHLTVERDGFSYVLKITVTSTDAAKSQRLAMAVAKIYLDDQLEARYEATQRATSWLAGRLDDLRARVIETETAIEKLKAENGLSDTGPGGNVSQQQMYELNAQLVLARADLAEKRARYDQARRVVDSHGNIQTIAEVLSSPVIGQLRMQQAEVSRREADLRSRFGERYPEVLKVRSELDDVDKAINAEVSRILDNLKNTYQVTEQRVRSLETGLGRLTEQRGNSVALVKLGELQRVNDADRKIYQTFLAMFDEIQQRATLNDIGARIINPPTLPGAPSFPRQALIYSLVAAVSLLVGMALAFLKEYLDAGFKTVTQIERTLGYPVLGMIPLVRGSGLRRHVNPDFIVDRMNAHPFSRLSEVVTTVRMVLMRSTVDRGPKVVLITSGVPGEGKSTAAMLLAASSSPRQQTVLVDCDLRRKYVSAAFGRKDKPGLTEILSGGVELSSATFVDKKTSVAVITAGSVVPNPADLFRSQRMRDLLKSLREHYGCIVLDAPPLLPVVDAAVLADMADEILVVVEWSRTPRRSVEEAMKVLAVNAQRRVGIVINKVDYARLRTYGYGYGYGYNYGYYYRRLERYYHRS